MQLHEITNNKLILYVSHYSVNRYFLNLKLYVHITIKVIIHIYI